MNPQLKMCSVYGSRAYTYVLEWIIELKKKSIRTNPSSKLLCIYSELSLSMCNCTRLKSLSVTWAERERKARSSARRSIALRGEVRRGMCWAWLGVTKLKEVCLRSAFSGGTDSPFPTETAVSFPDWAWLWVTKLEEGDCCYLALPLSLSLSLSLSVCLFLSSVLSLACLHFCFCLPVSIHFVNLKHTKLIQKSNGKPIQQWSTSAQTSVQKSSKIGSWENRSKKNLPKPLKRDSTTGPKALNKTLFFICVLFAKNNIFRKPVFFHNKT